jgi:hypothetical protein
MDGNKEEGFPAIMGEEEEEMDVSNPTNEERDDKNTANHSMELKRFGLAMTEKIGAFGFFACSVFLTFAKSMRLVCMK